MLCTLYNFRLNSQQYAAEGAERQASFLKCLTVYYKKDFFSIFKLLGLFFLFRHFRFFPRTARDLTSVRCDLSVKIELVIF